MTDAHCWLLYILDDNISVYSPVLEGVISDQWSDDDTTPQHGL